MEETNRGIEVSKLFKEVFTLLRQSMTKGFENSGITAPQGMVIGVLSRHGKMKVSELSDKMGLSNSTVSGIIDRLEKQEMVERERSKEDKRVVYVSLCPKFEETNQSFHKKVEESIGNVVNKGTHEDIDKIVDGFTILKRLLNDHQE